MGSMHRRWAIPVCAQAGGNRAGATVACWAVPVQEEGTGGKLCIGSYVHCKAHRIACTAGHTTCTHVRAHTETHTQHTHALAHPPQNTQHTHARAHIPVPAPGSHARSPPAAPPPTHQQRVHQLLHARATNAVAAEHQVGEAGVGTQPRRQQRNAVRAQRPGGWRPAPPWGLAA